MAIVVPPRGVDLSALGNGMDELGQGFPGGSGPIAIPLPNGGSYVFDPEVLNFGPAIRGAGEWMTETGPRLQSRGIAGISCAWNTPAVEFGLFR